MDYIVIDQFPSDFLRVHQIRFSPIILVNHLTNQPRLAEGVGFEPTEV